jgi:phosphatidylinositol alpha 1,6-mannosyltransferase
LATFGCRPELIRLAQPEAMQRDPVLAQRQPRSDRLSIGASSRLRVAVVAESFLPTGNGVTTSVCRVLEHLSRRGHDAVVICPGPAPESFAGAQVIGVPSISYRQFPIGMPSSKVIRTLSSFAPDVVHLASPFVLGAAGVTAAGQLGVPSVAIFQTDVPGFIRQHSPMAGGMFRGPAWRWIRRIHEQADLTLAPSSAAMEDLREHAVPRLALWQRGVDGERFSPQRRSSPAVAQLRGRLAPNGEVLVGYVGRLSSEKRVERLVALAGLPGVRVVVIGDGPHRRTIERALLPTGATFLGWLDGEELASAYAALDIFVHTGTSDTFGQTLQEAMASGVPVVAPASGGPLDQVAPGLNGMLYGPEDDAGLRTAVAALAADLDQRRWMGTAARVGVERRTWEVLGDELIGHYRRVLARRPIAA